MCLHLCEPPFLPFIPLNCHLIKGFAIFLKTIFCGHPVHAVLHMSSGDKMTPCLALEMAWLCHLATFIRRFIYQIYSTSNNI